MPSKHVPIWTPGCGRPHPNLELIIAWAKGNITLVDKQRITEQGKPYGSVLKTQYPGWNPDEWQFQEAKNSQMVLDLNGDLTSTKKVRIHPRPPKTKKLMDYEDFSRMRDPVGLALG